MSRLELIIRGWCTVARLAGDEKHVQTKQIITEVLRRMKGKLFVCSPEDAESNACYCLLQKSALLDWYRTLY